MSWFVPVGTGTPPPSVEGPLRVSGLVLVDDAGHEVGRWVRTPAGSELVVGGESQISLVTDGGAAAVNVLAEDPAVRTWTAGPGDP